MGLGPPVCEKCEVYGTIDVEQEAENISRWYCPVCNNDHMQWSAWDCGISHEQLVANLKFFKFAMGEENDTPTDR